jgi:hypothetical protein
MFINKSDRFLLDHIRYILELGMFAVLHELKDDAFSCALLDETASHTRS